MNNKLTSFACQTLKFHKADAQLVADLAVGRTAPFLMQQWEHLANQRFLLQNRLFVVKALGMITEWYLELPRKQQGTAQEVGLHRRLIIVLADVPAWWQRLLADGECVQPLVPRAEAGCGCRSRHLERALPPLAGFYQR